MQMTLKDVPKVKSNIRRFLAQDFVLVGFTLQTSRINNKQAISSFIVGYSRLMLKGGSRSNLTTSKDSQPMISYKLDSHCKPLRPIMSEL